MLPLPNPKDFDVSLKTGFLPEEAPVARLSNPYYEPWEKIADNLPSLLLTKQIRNQVDKLPILNIDKLKGVREQRRAYSILCFFSHAYVWGIDESKDTLPMCLSDPLLKLSDILDIPPVATYAGLVLWNFKNIIEDDDNEEGYNLNNISTVNTYTGSIDESWFYLVSVYFEKNGADCISTGLEILKEIRNDNIKKVISNLQTLAENIDKLGSILMKMEEMCDPHTFYFRIRPYLAGWSNMAEAGLPDGLKYGNESEYRKYSGGSNAQSSLIQFLDVLLNIEHFPTGSKPANKDGSISGKSGKNNFMNDMKNYMPGKHREFLNYLSQVSNTREYVVSKNNQELTLSYDACIAMLKSFRDKHIQIVTRYIILQAKKGVSTGKRSGISNTKDMKEQKGTGGTSLIPFLKQCRDETGEKAASDWGQKILSNGVLNTKSNDDDNGNKRQKLGLGNWKSSDEDQSGHW